MARKSRKIIFRKKGPVVLLSIPGSKTCIFRNNSRPSRFGAESPPPNRSKFSGYPPGCQLVGGVSKKFFGRWDRAVIGSGWLPGGFGMKTGPGSRPHLEPPSLVLIYRSKMAFLAYFSAILSTFQYSKESQRQTTSTLPHRSTRCHT